MKKNKPSIFTNDDKRKFNRILKLMTCHLIGHQFIPSAKYYICMTCGLAKVGYPIGDKNDKIIN